MVEVVFGDSAAGSMAIAMCHPSGSGPISVVIPADGKELSKRKIRRLQQEAAERERQNWAQALPLPGNRADILPFCLALSVGQIAEVEVGPQREAALMQLMAHLPAAAGDHAQKSVEDARRNLSVLSDRAKQGEHIRIWTSHNPDEACGACWLIHALRPIGFDRLHVTLVTLPLQDERPDSTSVIYQAWGEVEPHQWGRLAQAGKQLRPSDMHAMANCWAELSAENAPLRAVINGRLVSVPETLYDTYILRELAEQPPQFMEAELIGAVLGKYQLGIGDGWVALRLEQWIAEGCLMPISQPEPNAPTYRRTLRKCGPLNTEKST